MIFDAICEPNGSWLAIYAKREDFAGIVWCILFAVLFGVYYKEKKEPISSHKIEAFFSVVFALIMLFGKSFSLYNNWNLLLASKKQVMLAFIAGLGWSFLFYALLKILVAQTNKIFNDNLSRDHRIQGKLFGKRTFAVILAGWIPYLLTYFPGNVPHDGMYQLSMWFGYDKMTNHHPWFMTMLFGTLMGIGQRISDNAGIFLIVLFQFLVCAGIYSYISVRVLQFAGKTVACLTVAFFAFVPMWGC